MLLQILAECPRGRGLIFGIIPDQIGCGGDRVILQRNDFGIGAKPPRPGYRRSQGDTHLLRDIFPYVVFIVTNEWNIGIKTLFTAFFDSDPILG